MVVCLISQAVKLTCCQLASGASAINKLDLPLSSSLSLSHLWTWFQRVSIHLFQASLVFLYTLFIHLLLLQWPREETSAAVVLQPSFPSARLAEAETPEAVVTVPEAAVVVIGVVGEEIAEHSEVVDAEVTSEEVVVVDEVVECLPGKQDQESLRMSTVPAIYDHPLIS